MRKRGKTVRLLLFGVASVVLTLGTVQGQYVTEEVRVVQMLRQIHAAQVAFKSLVVINEDQDYLGECGSQGSCQVW